MFQSFINKKLFPISILLSILFFTCGEKNSKICNVATVAGPEVLYIGKGSPVYRDFTSLQVAFEEMLDMKVSKNKSKLQSNDIAFNDNK